MEKMATVDKTDAEQSAWENYLADLEQDEVIDMPEEVYDQWEEVTTTPKKKTTKPTTPKQETKTEDNSDLREKIGDRFYNYLKEHADNVNRSRKTLAPVTIEELLTS
jgi:hypothetical protein